VVIPKPGKDISNPWNYRPISLLCSISKVLKMIILKLLNTFVSTQNILPNHQFGFRVEHSHQLNRVVKHVKNKRGLGQITGMLLLDVEKAFDSVWHDVSYLLMWHYNQYLVKACLRIYFHDCLS
jgi:hypothetical protein